MAILGFGITFGLEKAHEKPRRPDGEDMVMAQPYVPKIVNRILLGVLFLGFALGIAHNFIPGFPVRAIEWTPTTVMLGPVDERFIAALQHHRAHGAAPMEHPAQGNDNPFDFT